MNKNEFFSILDKKLFILKEKERKDIIDEYISHIEFKMQDGKTEEEAISDFGDIDDLAQEILEAYHIDNNTSKSQGFDSYLKSFVDFINKTTEKILKFSSKDIARILVEFFVIIIVIMLISVPFKIIYSAANEIIHSMPFSFLLPITGLLGMVLEICKLGLSVLIIYNFIKIRILSRTVDETSQPKNNIKNESFDFDTQPQNNIQSDPLFATNENSIEEKEIKPKFQHSIFSKSKKNKQNLSSSKFLFGDFFMNFLIVTTKFLVFLLFWIPILSITIFGIIGTIFIFMLLIIKGIGFWGVCIISLGFTLIGIACTSWLTGFIFGGKNKNA